MIKEEKTYFSKVLALTIVILLLSTGILLYKFGNWQGQVTAMTIKTNFESIYTNISSALKIFLISSLGTLILLLSLVFVRDKGVIKRRKELQGIDLKKINEEPKTKTKGCKTDLDTVYTILQEKGELRISTISKLFKINKNTALEWAKILESGRLAKIEYPGFGEPILRSKDYEFKKQDEFKKSEIKTIQTKKINKKEIKKTNWLLRILIGIIIGAGISFAVYYFREQIIRYLTYLKNLI